MMLEPTETLRLEALKLTEAAAPGAVFTPDQETRIRELFREERSSRGSEFILDVARAARATRRDQ